MVLIGTIRFRDTTAAEVEGHFVAEVLRSA